MSRYEFKRRGIRVPPTTSEADAIEVAYRVLSVGARDNLREFTEPDDDWMPIWFVVTQRQGTVISGNAPKHEMAEYVGRWARHVGAVAIGHLHSSWLVNAEDIGEERMRELQQRGGLTEGIAERQEILLLGLYSATTARQHHAGITRHENAPPTLSAFDLVYDSANPKHTDLVGAMVDPLREALVRLG